MSEVMKVAMNSGHFMIKIQKCLYLGAYLLQSRESRDFITDIRETDSGLFWQRCLEKEFRRLYLRERIF